MRGEFITGTNKVSNPPLAPDLLATNLHTRRCISLHTSNSALSLLLPSVLVLLQPPGGSCKEAIAAGNQKPRISLGCTGMGCFSRSPCISRGAFRCSALPRLLSLLMIVFVFNMMKTWTRTGSQRGYVCSPSTRTASTWLS